MRESLARNWHSIQAMVLQDIPSMLLSIYALFTTELRKQRLADLKFILINTLVSVFFIGMSIRTALFYFSRKKMRKEITHHRMEAKGQLNASVMELLIHMAREELVDVKEAKKRRSKDTLRTYDSIFH